MFIVRPQNPSLVTRSSMRFPRRFRRWARWCSDLGLLPRCPAVFFLLKWETSKSSNMWWEKYGKSCRSWAQSWWNLPHVCSIDTGCRYDIIMYGYVIARTGLQAYIAPTFFYLWLTRSHLIWAGHFLSIAPTLSLSLYRFFNPQDTHGYIQLVGTVPPELIDKLHWIGRCMDGVMDKIAGTWQFVGFGFCWSLNQQWHWEKLEGGISIADFTGVFFPPHDAPEEGIVDWLGSPRLQRCDLHTGALCPRAVAHSQHWGLKDGKGDDTQLMLSNLHSFGNNVSSLSISPFSRFSSQFRKILQ